MPASSFTYFREKVHTHLLRDYQMRLHMLPGDDLMTELWTSGLSENEAARQYASTRSEADFTNDEKRSPLYAEVSRVTTSLRVNTDKAPLMQSGAHDPPNRSRVPAPSIPHH